MCTLHASRIPLECMHKCMRIICVWPQSESSSPLVLTALKSANRVELFAAELRPFAQQRSLRSGITANLFPGAKELGETLTCRVQEKVASFTCVQESHLRGKRWQPGGAASSRQWFWKSEPRGKMFAKPRRSATEQTRGSLPWLAVNVCDIFCCEANR